MERYLKKRERVKIISNNSNSSHKIGSIGIVKECCYNTTNMPLSTYLIDVDGKCNAAMHWSYGTDLELMTFQVDVNSEII